MVDILDGDRAQAIENLKIEGGKTPNCKFYYSTTST